MSASSSTRRGRILTFYSYKGGTGRSMAVANVAWILASRGKDVLVIDWDLEAPGLHRYFHPLLEDPELENSAGLIDYFYDVVAAAGRAGSSTHASATGREWWQEWTSLLRYTHPLLHHRVYGESTTTGFGSIDLIPAGRQSPEYGERIGNFDWRSFYQRLGGGVLLEAVKERLRSEYDYVLIDSRTGLSDTSGICTVQMPDDLVVCFTLNRQSVRGAAAVARSAKGQRLLSDGTPGLRIWPVPTRVELSEKDRLEAARVVARDAFREHIGPLLDSRTARDEYWGRVEILYQPYFAYEEVLACFAERQNHSSSMLSSLEYLTGRLSDGAVDRAATMPESARTQALAMYVRATTRTEQAPMVFISYDREVAAVVPQLAAALEQAGLRTWYDAQNVVPGDNFAESIQRALRQADVVARVISTSKRRSKNSDAEVDVALKSRKRVVPILAQGASFSDLPPSLRNTSALRLNPTPSPGDYLEIASHIASSARHAPVLRPAVDPEDPQKGQWGGQSEANGRKLTATVKADAHDWFSVSLQVVPIAKSKSPPLTAPVTFHLHSTFSPAKRVVQPQSNQAALELQAWGAFTVGVEADDGATLLELDLSENTRFPNLFRKR